MKIIRNTADLAKYVEINATTAFRFFEPSVRTAERHLLPVLGTAQFDKIVLAVAGTGTITDDLKALAELAQEATANIAMAMSVTRLSVMFDENGARRNETEKIKSAYQYQEINLRESYVRAGFDAIDQMLALMESKPASFTEWTGSSAYKEYRKHFIQSGRQFNEKYAIRNASYTYLSIRYIMQRIEDFDIKPVLGKALFITLKQGLITGDLTDSYKALINDYIQPAVALLTMAKAVYEKAVDVTDFGVSINIIQDNSNSQQKQAAPAQNIERVAQQLREDGARYLSELAEELLHNPDAYPDYEPAPAEASILNIQNKQENSFIAV